MRMCLEPTSEIIEEHGVHARVWKGYDDTGFPVRALVIQVAVPKGLADTELRAGELLHLNQIERQVPDSVDLLV